MEEIKQEQFRIWEELIKILPKDGDDFLEQGDELHKIIFNTNKTEMNFEEAVKPAIRYLLKNHNPHTKIYIDYDRAELLEGQKCHNLSNEVPD